MAEVGALQIAVSLDMSKLYRQLAVVESAIRSVGKNDGLQRAFKNTEVDAKNLGGEVERVERSVSSFDRSARRASVGGSALQKAFHGIGDAIKLPAMLGVGEAFRGIGAAMSKLGPLEKVGADLGKIGDSAVTSGADLAGSLGPGAVVAGAMMASAAVGVGTLATALAGVASALILPTALLGGFAAAGYGIVKLATSETGKNSASNTALAALQKAVQGVGKNLGQAADPVAAQMLDFVTKLIPKVQTLGLEFLKAFGKDLPQVMPLATFAVNEIFKGLHSLGPVIQQLIGWVTANRAALEKMADQILSGLVPALNGLLKNMMSLASWAMRNWPEIKTVFQITFGAIGIIIQITIGAFKLMLASFQLTYRGISATTKLVMAVFSTMGSFIHGTVNNIGGFFSTMGRDARGLQAGVNNAFTGMRNGINNIAGQIGKTVGGMFKGAVNGAKRDLDGIVRALDGFIGKVNSSPLSKLGLHIGTVGIPFPGFAKGGVVPGMGSGDTVPAMLTPGEVVLNKAAVAGLGGASAANKLNMGLGAGGGLLGNLGGLIGSIGGQCLAWVSKVTGLFRGIPAAKDLLPMVNSHTPSLGEIFVMGTQIGPYGHTGFVTGASGGQVNVLDSNWNLDERIRAHSVPASLISGYINTNLPGAILSTLGSIGGGLNPASIIGGLMGKVGFKGLFGSAIGPSILRTIKPGLINKAKGLAGGLLGAIAGAAPSGGSHLNVAQMAADWIKGGGPANVAHLMGQIGMAESSGNPAAIGPGGSWGLWQVQPQAWNFAKTFDPVQQARDAVAIYRKQGLQAWSTYDNGSFARFDRGGMLMPGLTMAYNGTGKPESIRTAGQEDLLVSEIRDLKNLMSKKLLGQVNVTQSRGVSSAQVMSDIEFATWSSRI